MERRNLLKSVALALYFLSILLYLPFLVSDKLDYHYDYGTNIIDYKLLSNFFNRKFTTIL